MSNVVHMQQPQKPCEQNWLQGKQNKLKNLTAIKDDYI